MDFLPLIKEYLQDIGYTPAFIILLGMLIFIAALKVIKVSRETIKNSNKNNLPAKIEQKDSIMEESEFIEKSLEKLHVEHEALLSGGEEVSISNLQEDQVIKVYTPIEPETGTEIEENNTPYAVYFNSEPEVDDFQLFTNPKHIFSGALKEIFYKKLKIVINNMPVYRLTRFPFFKVENNQVSKFFLDEKPELVIEELFELWRMGYKSDELPLLFVHYFFSIKSEQAVTILKSILNHKLLSENDVQNIIFLYGDLLGIDDRGNYVVSDLNNGYDAFIISDYIRNSKIELNRTLWQKWENDFFNHVNEDQKGRFFLFYFNELESHTSYILKYVLLNKYKHILTTQWREYIERQAFHHGHYDKLNRLAFVPPEYNSLITKTPVSSRRELFDLLHIILNKENSELHKFLVLHLNKHRDLKTFTIPENIISGYINRLNTTPRDDNYLPQAIRFLLFLYYYDKEDLNNMNLLRPNIKGNIGKFIPKLYQLRLIFKNKEYQRAYEEMKELWDNDEDNMLLMNETAIYAYHVGKIEEAEELFSRLRDLYPHNAQVLHNESVFLKYKSRLLSEKRRKQEEKLQNNPVRV